MVYNWTWVIRRRMMSHNVDLFSDLLGCSAFIVNEHVANGEFFSV
jgi:hypothetical protein